MALDFPASPTTGQLFTAAGTTWAWDSAKWVAGANPATSVNNVGRNLVHNSMFNIQQRGTGPFATTGNYTADRWQIQFNASQCTVTLSPLSAGDIAAIGDEAAITSLSCVFTGTAGAADFAQLVQKMEGIKRFAGKTVTVSFWAAASASLKLGVNIGQNVGSGGSFSGGATTVGQSVTLSTNWARYSLTFALASSAGWTLGTNGDDRTVLILWYSSGANNNTASGNIGVQSGTVNIWGAQVEVGPTATILEKLDPVLQLQQCQRFYCIVDGHHISNVSSGGFYVSASVNFPVTMRAVPATFVGPTNLYGAPTNCGAITADNATTRSVRFLSTSVGAGTTAFDVSFTASADL